MESRDVEEGGGFTTKNQGGPTIKVGRLNLLLLTNLIVYFD